MRFITLLIYIVIGVIIAWFASQNWERTALWLPGGYEAYWPLGLYIIAAVLIGLLPMALIHSMSRWRLRSRIRRLEKKLAAATAETESATTPRVQPAATPVREPVAGPAADTMPPTSPPAP